MSREILYIFPVEGTSVVGRQNNAIVNRSDGRKVMKKGNKTSGSQIPLCFEKDSKTGQLKTGLGEMTTNIWHEDAKPNYMLLGTNWSDEQERLSQLVEISLQEHYEILDNVPKGTYSSTSGTFNMAEMANNKQLFTTSKPTKLDDFTYYLSNNNFTVLDGSQGFRQRMGIQIMKNSSLVAKSRELINQDKHSFYIGTATESQDAKRINRARFQKALGILEKLEDDHSSMTRYQMGVLLEIFSEAEITDGNVINLLSSYFWEEKLPNFPNKITRITRATKLYEMYKKDYDAFYIDYLFRQAINSRVFRLQSGKVFWPSKREILNLYDLGTNQRIIKQRFLDERKDYDPQLGQDNLYGMLITELGNRGIKLDDN